MLRQPTPDEVAAAVPIAITDLTIGSLVIFRDWDPQWDFWSEVVGRVRMTSPQAVEFGYVRTDGQSFTHIRIPLAWYNRYARVRLLGIPRSDGLCTKNWNGSCP